MGNKITETTNTLFAKLAAEKPQELKEAEERNFKATQELHADPFTLAESLNLAKAIKYISSVDGFSPQEAQGLNYFLKTTQAPDFVLKSVEDFDVSGVTMDDVVALYPSGSLKAKQLINGIIVVAICDGFSNEEREATLKLAQRIGLRPELVHAYEARNHLGCLITDNKNEELTKARVALRKTMWELM
jgi:hypothetical protein